MKNEKWVTITIRKVGLPYQTVLNLLIGQYASGKIKLAI